MAWIQRTKCYPKTYYTNIWIFLLSNDECVVFKHKRPDSLVEITLCWLFYLVPCYLYCIHFFLAIIFIITLNSRYYKYKVLSVNLWTLQIISRALCRSCRKIAKIPTSLLKQTEALSTHTSAAWNPTKTRSSKILTLWPIQFCEESEAFCWAAGSIFKDILL